MAEELKGIEAGGHNREERSGAVKLWSFLIFAVAVLLLAPFIGMKWISPLALFDSGGGPFGEGEVLWKIRLPRVAASFLGGLALGVSGMVFQAMFRNPLATPFTLGVSSGAALGASLYMRLGVAFSVAGLSGITIFAFLGAIFTIFFVYSLTRFKRGFSTSTMLLAGVAVSFFFSSLILFIQYMSDFTHSFRIIRWLMGGFEVVGFSSLWNMLPFVLIGLSVILYHIRELNILTTGEELALSRGVDVAAVNRRLFIATSLMVGGVVAVSGPIGFVGMLAPHICRLIIGPDHRYLTPATLLFGGAFLTLADTFARTVIAPVEIPVGVVTALGGGPFFLWLLLSGLSEKGLLKSSD